MKKFILISAFLSTLVFSSVCFAGWTLVSKNIHGDSVYIDFDRIKIKNKRYVFYWNLMNYGKLSKAGNLSLKTFLEADCGIPRKMRVLAYSFYPQPMALESPSMSSRIVQHWRYSSPGTMKKVLLNKVCAFAMSGQKPSGYPHSEGSSIFFLVLSNVLTPHFLSPTLRP